MPELSVWKQRPVEIKAFKWEPKIGTGAGVMARPKKHVLNPDEFFIKVRGKEIVLKQPCWIIINNDGSNDVIPDGQFQELFEPAQHPKKTIREPEPAPQPADPQPQQEKVPEVLKPKKNRAKKNAE